MSNVDGSHLHRKPPVSHGGPQILLPAVNRHFPFPSAAFDSRIFSDKPKIPPPDSLLKLAIKNQDKKVDSVQGHKEETRTHTPPTATSSLNKQQSRKSKHKSALLETLGTVDGVPDAIASYSCRYDSSLTTGRWNSGFKQGSRDFGSPKEEMYDITNVLEGVGLIEKSLKNRICWKGDDMLGSVELDNQIAEMKAANDALIKEECRIDGMIGEIQENIRALKEENNHNLLYLTKQDINSLQFFQNSTLIAIKAPHGTSIEVPDPDEALGFSHKRYQILLRSSVGPINCFLISNHEERAEASNEGREASPMDLSVGNSCDNREDVSCLSSPVRERDGGIINIVPEDMDVNADYWFESDRNCSLADTWNEH